MSLNFNILLSTPNSKPTKVPVFLFYLVSYCISCEQSKWACNSSSSSHHPTITNYSIYCLPFTLIFFFTCISKLASCNKLLSAFTQIRLFHQFLNKWTELGNRISRFNLSDQFCFILTKLFLFRLLWFSSPSCQFSHAVDVFFADIYLFYSSHLLFMSFHQIHLFEWYTECLILNSHVQTCLITQESSITYLWHFSVNEKVRAIIKNFI